MALVLLSDLLHKGYTLKEIFPHKKSKEIHLVCKQNTYN